MTHANAHLAWDRRWANESGRADWLEPEPFVMQALAQPAGRVLDLGCGVGRHALALAAMGWQVTAHDGAPAGLDVVRQQAGSLPVTVRQGGIHHLPDADATFDALLSWNVIYHGTGAETARAMAEIDRVLRPGGTLVMTFLSTRNARYGEGREIAPATFVIDGEEEKDHAHFYAGMADLVGLLAGYEVLTLEQRTHRKPGSWHWHVHATRRT